MEKEKPSYYAIIPSDVRYDERLSASEKIMYGEITCLSNKTGECWAKNEYFAELYHVSQRCITGWITHLRDLNYIEVEFKEGTRRVIKIRQSSIALEEKRQSSIEENFQPYNNINIDNTTRYNSTQGTVKNESIKSFVNRITFKSDTNVALINNFRNLLINYCETKHLTRTDKLNKMLGELQEAILDTNKNLTEDQLLTEMNSIIDLTTKTNWNTFAYVYINKEEFIKKASKNINPKAEQPKAEQKVVHHWQD